MKIGFVTFCTENYINILNNLIESVLLFSKYDIKVYTINFELNHPSKRVTSEKIILDNIDFYHICKMKIYSMINTDYDIGLILDCDMIVTNKIDEIFDDNAEIVLKSKFPLFSRHPHNPFNSFMGYVKNYTNKTPNIGWVHANCLYSKKNKWFLEEVLSEMNKISHIPGEDELIINSLLTKYEATNDIGYSYIPYADDNFKDLFFGNIEDNDENNPWLKIGCPVKFFTFHSGEIKNPDLGKKLINQIKTLQSK